MEGKTRLTYFSHLNVTPLTDVFLVLLVVMLIICPIVEKGHAIKVDPPPAPNCPYCGPPPRDDVAVSADGTVVVNGRVVQPTTSLAIEAEFATILRESGYRDPTLCVQSDEEAMQRDIVSVIDAACGAGIKSVSIQPFRRH